MWVENEHTIVVQAREWRRMVKLSCIDIGWFSNDWITTALHDLVCIPILCKLPLPTSIFNIVSSSRVAMVITSTSIIVHEDSHEFLTMFITFTSIIVQEDSHTFVMTHWSFQRHNSVFWSHPLLIYQWHNGIYYSSYMIFVNTMESWGVLVELHYAL